MWSKLIVDKKATLEQSVIFEIDHFVVRISPLCLHMTELLGQEWYTDIGLDGGGGGGGGGGGITSSSTTSY